MIELLVKTGEEYKRLEQTDGVNYALTRMFQDLEDPLAIVCDHSSTFKVPATPANLAALGYASIVEFSTSVGVTKFDIMLVEGHVVIADGEGHVSYVYRENGFDWIEMAITSYPNRAMKTLKNMRWMANIPETDTGELIPLDDETFNLEAQVVKDKNFAQVGDNPGVLGFVPVAMGTPQRYVTDKYKGIAGAITYLGDYELPNTKRKLSDQFARNNKDLETWINTWGILQYDILEYRPYDLCPFFRLKGVLRNMSTILNQEIGWTIDDTELGDEYTNGIILGKRLKVQAALDNNIHPVSRSFGFLTEQGKVTIHTNVPLKAGDGLSMVLRPNSTHTIDWPGLKAGEPIKIDKFKFSPSEYLPIHIYNHDQIIDRWVVCSEEVYDSRQFKHYAAGEYYTRIPLEDFERLYNFSAKVLRDDVLTISMTGAVEFPSVIIDQDTSDISFVFPTDVMVRPAIRMRCTVTDWHPIAFDKHNYGTWLFEEIVSNMVPSENDVFVREHLDPTMGISNGDLWDGSFTPLQVITNFTKQYNIVWMYDSRSKTIKLRPKSSWMNEGEDVRVDDRLDYTKDYKVQMYPVNYKRINFNYDTNDTDYGKKQSENELIFGSMSYVTPVTYSEDHKELFKGLRSPILAGVRRVTLGQMLTMVDSDTPDFDFDAAATTKWMPYAQSEGSAVETFGMYYQLSFTFDSGYWLVDDTVEERKSREFYMHFYDMPGRLYQPMFTIRTDSNSLTYNMFAVTCRDYWSSEIDQLYGKDARAITCWFRLSPVEFHDWKFNNRYLIGNSAWRCLSLTDYDPNTGFAKATFSKLTSIS